MIISTEKKIAIFGIQKVGSVSLHEEFKSVDTFRNTHEHMTYDQIVEQEKDNPDFPKDFATYKFYSFYRDPVERCLSAVKFYKRTFYGHILNLFYGDAIQISCIASTPYDELSDELKAAIESIPNIDIVVHKYLKFGTILFKQQKTWLDNDLDLTLLDFANYDEEVKKLLALFDIDIPVVPKLNSSISVPAKDAVGQREIEVIKSYYQADYEFFASKGIQFP